MTEQVEATFEIYPYVVGLCRSALDNSVCFTEIIDNSLDADARSVQVILKSGKELVVIDTGRGIPNVDDLVRFGGHTGHRTGRTSSGIYGIGFKEAAASLGGERARIEVITVRAGKTTHCEIEWERLKTSRQCMSKSEVDTPDAAPGTRITIRPLKQRFPDGTSRDRFFENLSYIYWPAIKRGVLIQFQVGAHTHTLKQWEPPANLEDEIDVHIDLGGKRARLHAGIVPKGAPNDRAGITYFHGYRVVKRNGRDGCGTWNPQRVWGFVELDHTRSWSRSKNKTDLIDADDLYDEVEHLLTPMLKKAHEQAHTIEISEQHEALQALLQTAVFGTPDAKAKRDEGPESGTVTPTNTGRRHKKAKKKQDGETMTRCGGKVLQLLFMPGWKEGFGKPIGEIEEGRKVIAIKLFNDHPAVLDATSPWQARRLFDLAMNVFAFRERGAVNGQSTFVSSLGVQARFADLTAAVATIDGQSLTQAAE